MAKKKNQNKKKNGSTSNKNDHIDQHSNDEHIEENIIANDITIESNMPSNELGVTHETIDENNAISESDLKKQPTEEEQEGKDVTQDKVDAESEITTEAQNQKEDDDGEVEEEDDEEGDEDEDEELTQEELIEQLTEERDTIQNQYNTLLSKISGMKAVFQEMQNSKQELELLKDQLQEYETQNLTLKNKVSSLNKETKTLNEELNEYVTSLQSAKKDLKAQNEQITLMNSQLNKKEESSDRELEAMRIIKKDLVERNDELRMLLENSKNDTELILKEKEDLQTQVDDFKTLEKKLRQEIESLEKQNIQISDNYLTLEKNKETVEKELKTELESYKNEIIEKDTRISDYESQLEQSKELENLKTQLEEENKNKSLQIGKLRHEAIILNEHLTKALSMLKKSTDSDNVDKELISNLFISFVSIPRGDNKKFEVLELIANFLSWDNDQKTQAGLLHGNSSFKANNPNLSMNSPSTKSTNNKISKTESFVSMWTEFLQKESGQ